MRSIALVILLVLVAGCKVGPDYKRPALDIPAGFRNMSGHALEAVDTEWWNGFQDPVLSGLIGEALANNKNVKIAAASVEEAAAILTQTRAPLFPQGSYQAGAFRERISEHTAIPVRSANPFSTLQIFGGVNWELDFWGRIRRLTEAARADLLATEEGRRGVVLSLVTSVAGSYMQLRGLDEQLLIAKRNLAAYQESVKLYELQFQYGLVSQMVVEQARTQYETAAALIPQLESQIVQTENALSILLGRNPGPIARGRSINELSYPAVPAGLPSQLLERRPDLAQAEQNLVAANARIGAAKALYFPTISLTGVFGFESEHLSHLFSSGSRSWTYSGTLTGPVFTAGTIAGQVRQTKAIQQAALIGYQAAVQSAFADVENALIIRHKLVGQVEAQERLVHASREYERLAKLQYDGGYAPYLTVLNAEQQLFPAELNLIDLRARLFTSYANLYKAMGGGWVTRAEEMTEPGARRAGTATAQAGGATAVPPAVPPAIPSGAQPAVPSGAAPAVPPTVPPAVPPASAPALPPPSAPYLPPAAAVPAPMSPAAQPAVPSAGASAVPPAVSPALPPPVPATVPAEAAPVTAPEPFPPAEEQQ